MSRLQVLVGILVIVALAAVGITYLNKTSAPETQETTQTGSSTSVAPKGADPGIAVAGYVTKNINELSPISATTTGHFFVTKTTVGNGTGTVEYVDGKNTYDATFTFTFTGGMPWINNFKLRK